MSRRTWRRWMAGETRIPVHVVRLARILSGELAEIAPAWNGWRLVGGELVDPEGVCHTPASVRAWHWTRLELQLLRGEENQREKVSRIRTGRDAQVVTLELHRRLSDQ